MVLGDVQAGTLKPNGCPLESVSKLESQESQQSTIVANDKQQARQATKSVRCYYIDELGFYRHLDSDQQQYVCSNVISRRHKGGQQPADEQQQAESEKTSSGQEQRISAADGGYEICFKSMRKDLGISHFDRLDDYANWKRGWDEFMRSKLTSSQPVTLNCEFKNRVRTGIPHDYRCKVWSALIRMRTRAIRLQFGDDVYAKIVRDFVAKVPIGQQNFETKLSDDLNNNKTKNDNKSQASDETGGRLRASCKSNYLAKNKEQNQASGQRPMALEPLLDKCFKQIELDLLRTLPNNRHFEEPNSRGIQRVRRVLRAYASFNQSVGYCQGMNRLAAMALLVLPEEEAFWCLVAIIQCIMPKDYYLKPWLAQVDCCVLADLLAKKLPKLHRHLEKNDIQLTLFTWFFTIFVDGFRPELMLRIWDCFLLEGDKVLFRFALAILHITQHELMEMHDLSAMSTHLTRLVSTRQLDVERLFEIAFRGMNPLSSATIESRRLFHRNKIQSMLED